MADRRMDSPDERDDVLEGIRDALTGIDVTSIASAIIDDPTIGDCVGSGALYTDDLVNVISWAIPEAIDRDAIADAIMTSLRAFRSSSVADPPPQPSSMVDATMLREQILGMLLSPSVIHLCG
jgi:hypothetical protein